MRCLYREKKYICGEYIDVDIYPVFSTSRGGRGKKAKCSSAAQERLNQHNREKKFSRLVMTNFTSSDLCIHLTYNGDHLPGNDEAVKKQFRNFIARLKRYRKKHGLPSLKYMSVTERGSRNGRYHHHTIVNCGDMPAPVLVELWGQGYVDIKVLQFDQCGVEGLSRYFFKGRKKKSATDEDIGETIGYSWTCSRNLDKPIESKRDGRLSARKVKELSSFGEYDGNLEYEKLYPGYEFSQAKPFYNDINGGFYISLRMRKITNRKLTKKIRGE